MRRSFLSQTTEPLYIELFIHIPREKKAYRVALDIEVKVYK